MNARYELGSLNTLALVTVLLGATVGSVQAVAAMHSRTAATLTVWMVRFIVVVPLEPDTHAGRHRAGARIDVVVDAVQARGRVHTVVAGEGERVLNRPKYTDRLALVVGGNANRDVIHAEERRIFDEIVRVVLRHDEAGLEHRGVQVTRHPRAGQVLVGAIGGRHVVVDPVPQVGPQREAGVEVPDRD